MEKIYFATGNRGKLEEMKPFCSERDVELVQVDVDVPEIDAMDVEEVAERKVKDSFEKSQENSMIDSDYMMIVEDTGFFVGALDGFPGAEAAFFAKTAGVDRLLPMMESEEDRRAYFKTAIAVLLPEEERVLTFTGKMEGEIPEEKRGDSHPHLPYNSYFIPDHSDGESLAQNEDLKNGEMHRRKALEKFLDWFSEH